MMRPSVPSPTGTAIGSPVSVTSWPRTRPSVVSIAMVRTVDLAEVLRDLEHQAVALVLGLERVQDRRQVPFELHVDDGADDLGDASDCGFWPWLCHVFLARLRSNGSRRLLQRLGAGDDLDQLLGDHRLAGAVVGQRLLADHFAGVAGGVVHRGHLRAVERGGVLEQRAEDLHRDVARQQLGEDLVLVGLVFVGRAAGVVAAFALEHRRDDLLRGRDLRDHRLEAREEQRADVERPSS